MNAVLRLPVNTSGRDFVVGDIHGAFDLVIQAMRAAKFDPKRDRLLSVGDLIDRGAGSHRCLEFLAQPYVYAVRGNHDDEFSRTDLESMRILCGVPMLHMGWVRDVSDEKLLAIAKRLGDLPIAMEVETERGLVGLVHADVPRGMSWQEFTRLLELGDEAATECALTSRERSLSSDDSGVPGIGRVFIGHTPEATARRLGNVYTIDTGAVFHELTAGNRGRLTMADLQFATTALDKPGGPVDQPFRLLQERGVGPFGLSTVALSTPAAVSRDADGTSTTQLSARARRYAMRDAF